MCVLCVALFNTIAGAFIYLPITYDHGFKQEFVLGSVFPVIHSCLVLCGNRVRVLLGLSEGYFCKRKGALIIFSDNRCN